MKQEPTRNHGEAVSVNIALGDLAVIGHVLFPYARFVRFVIPASRERGITLTMIENLRRRIAEVNKGEKEGELFPLTVSELSIIDAALKNFVANLRQVFPPSQERHGTIGACERLREYLATSFALTKSDNEK